MMKKQASYKITQVKTPPSKDEKKKVPPFKKKIATKKAPAPKTKKPAMTKTSMKKK
mgnify:CR=1 FL=1